jgi:hypothetical protein
MLVGVGVVQCGTLCCTIAIRLAISSQELLVTGHVGDCVKSYNLCMILMCRMSTHKNNMGAFVVRTFLRLVKIIQNLYDD